MGSKTVVMSTKPENSGEEITPRKPTATLGIQSDTAFNEAAKRLCGRDLCSISDLTVQEMAAIMELAHAVKNHPEDFRHALDAKQMVMFFEKASCAPVSPSRRQSTHSAAMRSSSIKLSRHSVSVSLFRTWLATSSAG